MAVAAESTSCASNPYLVPVRANATLLETHGRRKIWPGLVRTRLKAQSILTYPSLWPGKAYFICLSAAGYFKTPPGPTCLLPDDVELWRQPRVQSPGRRRHSKVATVAVTAKGHTEPFQFITAVNRTQPIRLKASPVCGDFSSESFTEVNTGVNLNATKTIVAFGDSWTSNGSNGTIPFAPIVFPPNPSAGARLGNNFRARASNGYVWVEDLANTLGAKLIDYSVGGAVVDLLAWNTTNHGVTFTSDNLLRTDFVAETALFLQQGHFLADLNPDTTLYTVQFGINDFNQYSIAGGDWTFASDSFLRQISILQANGAKNFLIHWVNFQQNVTTTFQNVVHQGLQAARAQNGTNFATVNLANLFTAIEAAPAEWGYTNTTCLASQNFTDFGCNDPDRSIFYIPSHPSATTHEIMNQYTILTMEKCI